MKVCNLPLVSVIMNCYNGERFLKGSIDSVYSQTYSNWEIVFWDNASIDNSALIAKSYDRKIHYVLADKTTTLGKARGLAIKEASGKYIVFLDCDDIYLPKKIEKQVSFMESNEYSMCYASAVIIDEKRKELKKTLVKNQSGYCFPSLLRHYEVNIQTVMVRSSVLRSNNNTFQESLVYSPDYDLFMMIASKSQVGVIKDFLVKYRISTGSLSKKCLELVYTENKFTLDRILKTHSELEKKYYPEFNYAYLKLHYYKAIFFISRGDNFNARKQLLKTKWSDWRYIVLYIVLLFPIVKKKYLLRLVNR